MTFSMREDERGDSPPDDVLEAVGGDSADLMGIRLRRRSPVRKLLLGSHAQEILLKANCAVLTVKALDDGA